MKKNILILSASPRKGGNSDLLCDAFLRGATEVGHTVEKIRLAEKSINYCTGCCSCIGNPGACVQPDDMNGILRKMQAADTLVFATPVYFRAMNGQMKTLIDRTCPIYTMLGNKEVYFIIAAAGGSLPVESTVDSFRTFTGCLSNIKEKGVISVTGLWEPGVEGTRVMDEAYTAGKDA